MSNMYLKGFSTSLIIREIQIKTTIRYYLTVVRMSIIKSEKIASVGVVGRKRNPCPLLVGM